MHKENCTVGLESGRGLNMDMLSTTVAAVGRLVVPSGSALWRQSRDAEGRPPQTEGHEPANDSGRTSERRRRVFVLAPRGSSGGTAGSTLAG